MIIFHSTGKGMNVMAREALLTKHYLRRMPPISHAFMATEGERLVGVVTFGVPPSRHLQMSACPSDPSRVLELNRLWVAEGEPKNTASRIVAAALDQLPPSIVVSYADTAVGHQGYVYRACNFYYAGLTDEDRKTPRFDYVPRNGKHSRDAFRSGEFDRVRRKPKVKYWTVSGTRRDKRALLKIAGWPQKTWK